MSSDKEGQATLGRDATGGAAPGAAEGEGGAGIAVKQKALPRKKKPANNTQQQKKARQAAFLAAFSLTGNISLACKAAKINRATHYEWMLDTKYEPLFREAQAEAGETLEAEAHRRAVEGVNEPVVWQGRLAGQWIDPKTGALVPDVTVDDEGMASGPPAGSKFIPLTVKKYSDTLLIFLMKGAMPHKYRERRDITVEGGQVPVTLVLKAGEDVP